MTIENVGEFIPLLEHALSTLPPEGKIGFLIAGEYSLLQELKFSKQDVIRGSLPIRWFGGKKGRKPGDGCHGWAQCIAPLPVLFHKYKYMLMVTEF